MEFADTSQFSLQGPAIEVVVGCPERLNTRSWTISQALLCYHSSFFSAATQGGFEEAVEKRVALTEVDPSVFELFVEFIYYGKSNQMRDEFQSEALLYAQAWVLGGIIGAVRFKNHCIRRICEQCIPTASGFGIDGGYIEPETALYCFNNTTAESKLTALFQDAIICFWDNGEFIRAETKADEEEWMALFEDHEAFKNKLLFALRQGTEDRSSVLKDVGSYFEIEDK